MRVPLSWLKEYVDIDLPIPQLADLMTMAGMEVEHIHYLGTPEADLPWPADKFVIAHILKVAQHPDADRLVLATVDIGWDEPETVVTGAPNLMPYLGQGDISGLNLRSPFVLEGATVYDGYSDEPGKTMKLKGRKIRGIMNRHMLCSEKELGLSDSHEGIMMFTAPDVAPGTPLVDVLGEVVIEFDLLPNIARTASMLGVAREVAALTGKSVRYPAVDFEATGSSLADKLELETTHADLNPRFVAILVEDIDIKPSPFWMQMRLRSAGMRPINNVVDVSNYVMLEVGQPNHAFDWDVLKRRAEDYQPDGGPVKIITRLAKPDEEVETLDGDVRKMPESAILVTDPQSALSIGGVMGGAESEISDESQNLLIEAAAWNFINIRQTSSALKLHSEAGYRFSRGVHPAQALFGAKRAAYLTQKFAGGQISQDMVDYYPAPAPVVSVELTPDDVEHVLGIELSQAEIKAYLEGAEFTCEVLDEARLKVTVPDHRMDITPDPVAGRADLIEEVARLVGYGRIPATELSDTLPPQRNNTELQREELLRDVLVSVGMYEVINYRLTTAESETRLHADGSAVDERPYVTLVNPSSTERYQMRHSLLNSVLDVAAANTRFTERVPIFEIGHIYLPQEGDSLPQELLRLAMVLTGPREAPFWEGADTGLADFYDMKGIVETIVASLHLPEVSYQACERASFYPGRVAELFIKGQSAGVFGEVHPKVVAAYEMPEEVPVLAADLDLTVLLSNTEENFHITPLGRFPAVVQDIALVVDESVSAATVEAEIWQAGGSLLVDVALFDVYRGEQLGKNKKSLAYSLSFQAPDKTLTDRVVAKQQSRIVKKLAHSLDATLRS